MIHGIVRKGLWLMLLASSIDRATAVDPERLMSQYVRNRWGSDQGLQGEVHAISQTNDGYLWLGTEKGLFRFDGREFHQVTGQASSGLPDGPVLGLTVDTQGNLVVRLPERNLLRYSGGAFENTLQSLQPRELAITAMLRVNDSSVLVSGLTNGTLRYSNGRFETLVPVTSVAASPIISLAQSADGKVWMGTRDAGLFYADHGRVTGIASGLPGRRINALLAVGEDVWIATDAGMARWNGTEVTLEGVPSALRRASVLSLLLDRQSNLWIGSKSGLLRLNAHGLSSPEGSQNATGAVNTLFEDREGNLWSGGTNGIELLRDGAFTTYGRPENLPSDRNGAIFTDGDGRTWFAPIDGGLYWLKNGHSERITEAGLSTDVVYSITGGKDGLWVGRRRGGLTHLALQDGKFVAKNFTQAAGLAQNSVYSVNQSRDGTLWAGTLNGGVSRLRGDEITTYTADNGLASNTVAAILEGGDGTMWFATPAGLSSLANGRWRGYTVREGLPSDDVICLLEDSRGVIWIGTSAGLAFLNSGEIKAARESSEALQGPIFGVAEDRAGSLWIATARQMVRVNRDRLLRGVLEKSDLRTYGIGDGLRSVEGVRRNSSLVMDTLGRVWISMSDGISMTDPRRSADSSVPAIVHILSVSVDSSPLDLRSTARIPARPGRLTVAYSGSSLRDPDRVRFRYRLDGFERTWSEPTAAREATYTNLGPGSYRFRLIASNADGIWSPEETAIGFEIAPVFWQTGWFGLGVLLVLFVGILAIYRLRLRQVAARLTLGFEERLAERTRIAQELHDTLLQGFLSASMRLHVAVDQLAEDSPAKPGLENILQLMRQVIDEGRNTVRGMRVSSDASMDLQHAFLRMRDELALTDDVRFRVIAGGQARPLHPILRDEMYRIGREALVNAVRHSGAKNIEVELEYTRKEFRILVRDDGSGINARVLQFGREGHFGLEGMRERAERIGGRLHVYSSATAGTEVELTVSGHVAFQSKPRTVVQRWRERRSQRTAKG